MVKEKQEFVIGQRVAALCFVAALALPFSTAAQPAQDERLEDALIELAHHPWKGDLDGMVKRGFVRLLTTYNPLFISYNGIEQRGLAVEGAREFEKHLRKKLR